MIRWQDHPRVCGEKVLFGSYNRSPQGSPPRARGKALPDRGHPLSRGITPAYAGKRAGPPWRQCLSWDHPRVRGEKGRGVYTMNNWLGSPPRTRGKDVLHCCRVLQERITPAYAGKSAALLPSVRLGPDHPRVRGEKPSCCSSSTGATGSPPRTRGKGFCGDCWHWPRGITPAYAGKSHVLLFAGLVGRDHPRVRGEKPQALPPSIR